MPHLALRTTPEVLLDGVMRRDFFFLHAGSVCTVGFQRQVRLAYPEGSTELETDAGGSPAVHHMPPWKACTLHPTEAAALPSDNDMCRLVCGLLRSSRLGRPNAGGSGV